MKISSLIAIAVLSSSVWAQTSTAPPPQVCTKRMTRTFNVTMPREMGKWWKNSEIAKKLELDNGQLTQLDQIFVEHKLKLIDYGAEMEKQDLKLQTLLDASPWTRALTPKRAGARSDPARLRANGFNVYGSADYWAFGGRPCV